jgi:hypothetical protein
MVLYPESVNFILHHNWQPDFPFNQEFPLGVTFIYFVGPDGHTYNLICFSLVVTFEFWPYCFFTVSSTSMAVVRTLWWEQ